MDDKNISTIGRSSRSPFSHLGTLALIAASPLIVAGFLAADAAADGVEQVRRIKRRVFK